MDPHVQPADKKKAAHGKPPRDNAATKKQAPASRALAAMARARDTRAVSPVPSERPATAPVTSVSAASTHGASSQVPLILPSAAASTAGGFSTAGDLMSQTPVVYDPSSENLLHCSLLPRAV